MKTYTTINPLTGKEVTCKSYFEANLIATNNGQFLGSYIKIVKV
jgi:hypothetical protein